MLFNVKIASDVNSIEAGNPCIDLIDLYTEYKESEQECSFSEWLQDNLESFLENQDVYLSDCTNPIIYWNNPECYTKLIDLLCTKVAMKYKWYLKDLESLVSVKALDTLYAFSSEDNYEYYAELYLLICNDNNKHFEEMSTNEIDELYPFAVLLGGEDGEVRSDELVRWARESFSESIDYKDVFEVYDSWENYAKDRLYDYTVYQSVTDKYSGWIVNNQ